MTSMKQVAEMRLLSSRHSGRLAHAELKGRFAAERSSRPVAEAPDEPQAATRDQQRQLLREDAPDLEWCDDQVWLGVGPEVPRPARYLRNRIVGLRDIDPHPAAIRIGERQRLPGPPEAICLGQHSHAR